MFTWNFKDQKYSVDKLQKLTLYFRPFIFMTNNTPRSLLSNKFEYCLPSGEFPFGLIFHGKKKIFKQTKIRFITAELPIE